MVKFSVCVGLLVQIVYGLPTAQQTYDGHKVYEILHNSDEDYRKLKDLELQYDLDIWKLPRHQNDSMYIRVSPNQLDDFMSELEKINVPVSTFIDNVQHLIDEVDEASDSHRRKKRDTSVRSSSALDLAMYHSYDTILNHMNNLAMSTRRLPGNISVSVVNVGSSYERRPIDLIKISKSSGDGVEKQGIFIDGGIHAREWIAPAVVLYFMEQLIYNPDQDPEVDHIMDSYDVYLLPVVNPDGYEFSRAFNRLWRKNRRFHRNDYGCYGVDLNRNFPYMWDPDVGGSTFPCSDVYSGPYGGSEPETQALSGFLRSHGSGLAAYLTLHSFGQMWLYPWGFTTAYPTDSDNLDSAAWFATRYLKGVYGTEYEVGSATNVLYAAAGGSDDYAKGAANIPYAYTLELRDTGLYGFLLPEDQILPTGRETFAGFVKFVLTMQELEEGHTGPNTGPNTGPHPNVVG